MFDERKYDAQRCEGVQNYGKGLEDDVGFQELQSSIYLYIYRSIYLSGLCKVKPTATPALSRQQRTPQAYGHDT